MEYLYLESERWPALPNEPTWTSAWLYAVIEWLIKEAPAMASS